MTGLLNPCHTADAYCTSLRTIKLYMVFIDEGYFGVSQV